MASARDLTNMGVPSTVAERTGWTKMAMTSTATTQGSAGGLMTGKGRGNRLVQMTAHAGDGAFTLPADAAELDEFIMVNVSAANSADVFPPSGHNFQALSDNVGVAVAAGASLHCIYLGGTIWMGRLTAVLSAT